MSNNTCPDCGNYLHEKIKRCGCGWIKTHAHLQNDYRCQHYTDGVRCDAIGTFCPRPYGNGPWYCSRHS